MEPLIININIGGEAGQGVQTLGNVIARTLFRYGYFVHTEQSYHSRIRGGHNAYRIRACAERPVVAPDDVFDLVLALNAESIQLYRPQLRENGIIISDETLNGDVKLPIQHLLKELKAPAVSATTILFAALCKALGLPETVCTTALAEEVGEKHKDLNLALFNATQKLNIPLFCSLPQRTLENKIMLTTSDAVGFGALVAGCRLISAYPMTPGSSVFAYLAGKEKDYGVVAEQAEDEIAALNMAIGANFAGVRSMVTTAGGGFALMVEALSLSAMTETPVVIHIGQRPAPATGMATRTAQEDLWFVLHAGHGEFPRYIVAPTNPADAFYLTIKAFQLAEKYQIPAIILSEQYLADAFFTVDKFNLSGVKLERYFMTQLEPPADGAYLRYKFTPDGVSPMLAPGQTKWTVVASSDEHDEYGHISEDLENRKRMVEKRLKKLKPLAEEIEPPLIYPSDDAGLWLVGWGGTWGAIKEAVDLLRAEGKSVSLLHFRELFPFRTQEIAKILSSSATRVITVEENATAQLAQLIRRETLLTPFDCILKYWGRPFSAREIITALKNKGLI